MSPTLKSTGGGPLWAQISGCSPWSRFMMFGSAESYRPTLTNREIIFEEFQPMWSQSTNVANRQMDGETTCDRKTALCTKVHREVKKSLYRLSSQPISNGSTYRRSNFENVIVTAQCTIECKVRSCDRMSSVRPSVCLWRWWIVITKVRILRK